MKCSAGGFQTTGLELSNQLGDPRARGTGGDQRDDLTPGRRAGGLRFTLRLPGALALAIARLLHREPLGACARPRGKRSVRLISRFTPRSRVIAPNVRMTTMPTAAATKSGVSSDRMRAPK